MLESENYDKQSMNSEVSVNTDMKVFNGAISLLNKGKHVHGNNSNKKEGKKLTTDDKKKISLKDIMTKLKGNTLEDDIYEQEPLSFRHDEANNVIVNDDVIDEGFKSEGVGVFRVDDYEESNGGIDENGIEQTNNIFWKIKEQGLNNPDVNFDNKANNFKIKYPKLIKNNTTSEVSCTISKFEKGFAVLVSSDDHIFSIPTCFLPRFVKVGNTYKINFEETGKVENSINSINELQKRLANKSNETYNKKNNGINNSTKKKK
jgi:hypothetical protein